MTMRIAKYLARLGVCSRREAEKLIAQERVTVNGEVLKDAAFNVSGDEKILLDGEKLPKKQLTRLWLYHKPAGLVTTHKDEKNRSRSFPMRLYKAGDTPSFSNGFPYLCL